MSIFYQNQKERLRFYTSDNNTFATHLHRQAELIIVLEGQLSCTINHSSHKLSAGEGALVFPNQLHSLTTDEQSRILLCIFDEDFCRSYRKQFQNSLPSHNFFTKTHLSPHSEIATEGLLTLTGDFPRGSGIPPKTLALAEGYLTLLLADIMSILELVPKTISGDLELEQHLLIYLDSHFTEDLSLEKLSRRFGVSRFVLSRLFTDRLHTTFTGYVNSKRLEFSKELLLSGELSVTEIALESGFGSSRTFFREFQKAFRTTPGEYRKAQLRQSPLLPYP